MGGQGKNMPGHLSIIGLGPGGPDWLTAEAKQALDAASDLVGYGPYLDLVPELAQRPRRHASDNRVELDRARQALDLAAGGRKVALVCSGDPGIFAMAAAVMEVLESEPDGWRGVSVRTCPGISAMQAAAARSGAPLGHHFCVISLSDIRKPWALVEQRLTHALKGDFVIALYNPASKSRRRQIAQALELAGRYRPAETPVIVARNLGRAGESVRSLDLAAVNPDEIDMRTILVIGSRHSRRFTRADGATYTYAPRSQDISGAARD